MLLGLYALFIILAAKRGFVLTLINLIGSVIAFYLAFKLSGPAASYIYSSFFKSGVTDYLTARLPASLSASQLAIDPASILEYFPPYVSAFISRFGILPSSETISSLGNIISVRSIEENIVAPAVTGIIKLLCFALFGIILLILIKILARTLSKLIRYTPFKKLNTAGGAVLGAARGLITITIICAILIAVSSFMSGSALGSAVAESKICGLVSSIKFI